MNLGLLSSHLVWSIWLSLGHFDLPLAFLIRCLVCHMVKIVTLVKCHHKKVTCVFHAPSLWSMWINRVGPFEKSHFLVMFLNKIFLVKKVICKYIYIYMFQNIWSKMAKKLPKKLFIYTIGKRVVSSSQVWVVVHLKWFVYAQSWFQFAQSSSILICAYWFHLELLLVNSS
jgi:hypothetical protein